jgi:hypothetical protein
MLDMPLVADDASWRERLFSWSAARWPAGALYPPVARRQLLADSDSDIKAAYLLTMNMWHEETVKIIRAGRSGEFHPDDSAENIAWRLIALVCGLDGIYALGMKEIDDAAFNAYHYANYFHLHLVTNNPLFARAFSRFFIYSSFITTITSPPDLL